MVSSYVSNCLACCNRKSFRSISPPPPPRNSVPPTNTSTRHNAFNQNPFQITRNKTPYQSPNRTPMRNQDATAKGTILFHGSPAGPSGSTRGSKHYLEGSIGTLKRRMLSAPTLSTRKPFETSKISTSRKEKEKENERSEQDEWYMVKKITPGERNCIPKDDADEPIFYDKNGNRISNYRRRTPRSLPVSRTTSAEDEDFKIEQVGH
ncbi:hypothetical protein FCM35_KLT10710 [Carex littledalei]|uniref:Uncharacterized protein n=1 Tax=Carex littledalei TaxID=544730 RepID=A0A833VIV3_9POAL|nr:hypothetical protein FCM35_KLT10710 [Carex littledalei]